MLIDPQVGRLHPAFRMADNRPPQTEARIQRSVRQVAGDGQPRPLRRFCRDPGDHETAVGVVVRGASVVVGRDDRLVLLARSYAQADVGSGVAQAEAPTMRGPSQRPPPGEAKRVLVLGWSHKAAALLREFDSYAGERFAIDLMSFLPVEEREAHLRRHDLALPEAEPLHRRSGHFADEPSHLHARTVADDHERADRRASGRRKAPSWPIPS